MKTPEHDENDILFFFSDRPGELLGWLKEAWAFSEAKS